MWTPRPSLRSLSNGAAVTGGDARDALVEALYRASLEPAEWAGALGLLGAYVAGRGGGAHAALAFAEGPDTGWILASEPTVSERAYDLQARRHPLIPSAASPADDAVIDARRWASAESLATTSLAREVLPDGSVHGLTAVLHQSPQLLAVAHVIGRDGEAWGDDASARFASMSGHLGRALEVYVQLRRARTHAAIERSLLDQLAVGALVLDPRGALTRSNPSARALLARGDGLYLDGDLLRCETDRADRALRAVIAEGLAARPGDPAETRLLLVPRRSGRRPFILFLSPVFGATSDGSPTGLTVLLRDADTLLPEAEVLLARLFELTPSEVRVALGIAQGSSPQALAEHLGLSVETVRSHLKRVFFKTATRGQADLVRLVLGEMPPVAV
jgi:DNA-binding CsgD family transcriptional regulator/PAS domain-containing protein